jgi:hypothetical protein
VVVARNRKCLLNKIKVVIFQLMTKMPVAIPTMATLTGFTSPRYSGERKRAAAPYECINHPFKVLKRISQNISSTWNFLKCSNSNCMGKKQ